jgi:hypothetical protein
MLRGDEGSLWKPERDRIDREPGRKTRDRAEEEVPAGVEGAREREPGSDLQRELRVRDVETEQPAVRVDARHQRHGEEVCSVRNPGSVGGSLSEKIAKDREGLRKQLASKYSWVGHEANKEKELEKEREKAKEEREKGKRKE